MLLIEVLKSFLLGIVEGITEWLPISSTGHMILLNEFLSLKVSDDFWEMFQVVIQLGAILAVVVLFFDKLNPWSSRKADQQRRATWRLWGLVVLAVLPSAVVGVLLDDWLDSHFYNYMTVSVTLILYGIAFLVIEQVKKKHHSAPRVERVEDLTVRDALLVGTFQVLAVIPGTSRSGSTILGGMLFGLSRTVAAEFSFYLAIPTMAGASLLKGVKYFANGNSPTAQEWLLLAVGCLTAFAVSALVIRGLMAYVRRHSFSAFGVYRIVLGLLVLGYFCFT